MAGAIGALAGMLITGCGDDVNQEMIDAAPTPDGPAAADAAAADAGATGLPADWAAELELTVAEDTNADPNTVEIELVADETEVELSPGVMTTMYTYNGTYPGPRIEAKLGDRLIVHFTNNLEEETTIHWHGVELPAIMDGSNIAQLPVAPGESFTYEFDLLAASTYWYHPHIRSNEQVEKGLIGALVVRDPAQDAELGLPENEVTVILDDILLDEADGQIAPPFPADPLANAAVQLNGREGNTFLLNGRETPTIDVFSGEPIRLRLVNTANSRFFRLSVPGHTIHRIGGDGGLLESPVEIEPIELVENPEEPGTMMSDPNPARGLLLVPGERADIVLTPIGEAGGELALEWHDIARGAHVAVDNGDGTIGLGHDHEDGKRPAQQLLRMVFAEGSVADAASYSPPSALRTIEAIDATGAAVLPVTFGHSQPDVEGNVTFFATMVPGVGGRPFDALTADEALHATVGEVRIWEVTNLTAGDHPFHPHGFFFQPIEIEFVDEANPDNSKTIPAPFLENKDTILIPKRPGAFGTSRTIVRLAVRFDDSGRQGEVLAAGKDPTADASGGWIVHCHILEHADRGMMTFLNLEAAQ